MGIFSNIRSNLLRRCAEDIDGAGYPGAAEIMRQTDIGVFNLVWVSSPKLLYDFVNLSKAGRANRVPFGLQATTRINRQITRYLSPAFRGPTTAVSLLHKTEILGVDDLRDRKAIV